MAIGLSHGGTTIYSAPSLSNEVLVGTREGAVTLARDGPDWKVIHRSMTDKHISAIIKEPESAPVYLSERSRRIFLSATISARAGLSCRHSDPCRACRSGVSPRRRTSDT